MAAVALAILAAWMPAVAAARQAAPATGGLADLSPAARAHVPVRWIDVSVATLWVEPGQARALDAPACRNPADPRRWVAAMSTGEKRWLVGRLETQALYGTKVYVLATSGSWTKVAVTGQPTPRERLGYPGWLPTRQLTARRPAATPRIAVVRRPTAWLWRTAGLEGRVFEASYGTRLRAQAWTRDAVEVALLDGGRAYVRRAAVALHEAGTPWPALSGARLVAEARRFLGLEYLWAGTAGFGFDCSGFTWAVYAALGTTIPRDGAPQAGVGRAVADREDLRAGDLVFFAGASGEIHHVGLCIGGGRMIHAPATGRPVAIVSLSDEPYRSEFAGGRRLIPAGAPAALPVAAAATR